MDMFPLVRVVTGPAGATERVKPVKIWALATRFNPLRIEANLLAGEHLDPRHGSPDHRAMLAHELRLRHAPEDGQGASRHVDHATPAG